MTIYVHTLLLILFGAMLDFSGIKLTSVSFWIIVCILLGLFLSYDILIDHSEDK